MQQNLAHDLEEKHRTKDVLLDENVNFASLLLRTDIQKGLSSAGFKKPSPIQFKSIPLGRCGFDLVVKSKSGTGKTLVFSTIALETVNVEKQYPQVLILVPTREIAVQIQDVLRSIGRYIDGLKVEFFIGGLPVEDDVRKLKQCHVAVGAPGRVKHLINLGSLPTKHVRLFVLDEADKLMEPSFQSDINEIYESLPHRKQMITTSATYPKELDVFLTNYMQSPTHVTSENETPLLLGLKQFVAVLKANTIHAVQQMRAKNEILLEIFSKVSFTQCLVFTNYQTRTESVSNFLNQKGWDSSFISAASVQSERLEAINNLKNFKNRILLSTDLTSRGIDAPNVDLVVNYDLPTDAVTYLHRMGRAGRYGSAGICINFALEGPEIAKLQNILGTIGSTNLSIAKLPKLNGTDLWQVDPSGLEQIWGVLPTEGGNDVSETIKKEVFTLKQKNRHRNQKKGKKIKLEGAEMVDCKEDGGEDEDSKKRKIELEDLTAVLLKTTKEEVEKKPKMEDCAKSASMEAESSNNSRLKIEDLSNPQSIQNLLKKKDQDWADPAESVDAEGLLSSLASGNFEAKLKIEDLKKDPDSGGSAPVDTESLLRSLALGDNSIKVERIETKQEADLDNIDEDGKKRKRSVNDSLYKIQKEKRTFVKNKCLLSISKLLYDYTFQMDADLVESVDEYLQISKQSDLGDEQKTVEEILGLSSLKEEVPNVLEDIFKVGYDSAVGGKSWLSSLPAEELQMFQDACRSELVAVSSESEEEEEDDYEMEEAAESDVALQWVPVERSAEPPSARYFDECSDVLWQTGLTFETVEDFDSWYFQWREHLQSVRNYVQQNIYVDEMSKYQQSRLTNK